MSWFSEYKRSLKLIEVEEFVDLLVYRPLASLLVKLVYNTRISPDHLTLAAMISGLTGAVFYALGPGDTSNPGAFLFILFIVLDCSDGQLARLKKTGTPVGRILDGISDYLVVTSIYVGIAIGYSDMEIGSFPIILLLILSGASIIVQESLVDFYRMRFLDIVMQRNNKSEEDLDLYRHDGNWFERSIIFLYAVYSKIQSKMTSGRKRGTITGTSPQEYYERNRILVRFWVFIGPSAARTALIICSLFSRFDIYFWITILVFNIIAAILWLVQLRVDKLK